MFGDPNKPDELFFSLICVLEGGYVSEDEATH